MSLIREPLTGLLAGFVASLGLLVRTSRLMGPQAGQRQPAIDLSRHAESMPVAT
jgi:hypothetical protein